MDIDKVSGFASEKGYMVCVRCVMQERGISTPVYVSNETDNAQSCGKCGVEIETVVLGS